MTNAIETTITLVQKLLARTELRSIAKDQGTVTKAIQAALALLEARAGSDPKVLAVVAQSRKALASTPSIRQADDGHQTRSRQ